MMHAPVTASRVDERYEPDFVVETKTERTVVEDRPRGTLIPAYGRKGGDKVEERAADEPRKPVMDDRD